MIVNAEGAPDGARRDTAEPARPGPGRRTRRHLLRGLIAPAVAVTLAPLVAASRPPGETGPSGAPDADRPPRPAPAPGGTAEAAVFEETYRGRRIRGVRTTEGRALGDDDTWHVTVDGRPLHLMRRADGTWMSMVDHYGSHPTPLEAARAAVDELGPHEHLRKEPDEGGHDLRRGRHGVHP
ncbi:tyrosinase family oxidase copper chaperone [Streptomyces sp. NRRL F-5065]|uniref:tyrosinase family oxidase copper chaperone n=1 Tax=Streptomyces sp. NRRL F-5065 TaxID=1463855 RepID=UPI0004C0B4A1|nr:tyrosinase family oxidase copper chaperone [Streptomyces sp. NRRL F-5065]